MSHAHVFCVCVCLRWAECGTLGELSPAAVEQLQAACTQAVTQAYADGVDPLVFVPPQRGPDASPEEAAAAQAAAEAAVKIQKNKVAIVDDILQVIALFVLSLSCSYHTL